MLNPDQICGVKKLYDKPKRGCSERGDWTLVHMCIAHKPPGPMSQRSCLWRSVCFHSTSSSQTANSPSPVCTQPPTSEHFEAACFLSLLDKNVVCWVEKWFSYPSCCQRVYLFFNIFLENVMAWHNLFVWWHLSRVTLQLFYFVCLHVLYFTLVLLFYTFTNCTPKKIGNKMLKTVRTLYHICFK